MFPWVKDYIGIPFLSGGRGRDGCDCYGLVRLVLLEQYGYSLPSLDGTYRDALDGRETGRIFSDAVPLLAAEKITRPEEGAVALMYSRGLLCHVGIWAGGEYILHTRRGTGAAAERMTGPLLLPMFEGWHRIDPGYRIQKSVYT